MLKAQHPEFEMWNQGIHARSGVACADCHMPYTRVGATKISDHHVRSPLLNINRACQTCHKFGEDELRGRVHAIQDRTFALRARALDAVDRADRGARGGPARGAARRGARRTSRDSTARRSSTSTSSRPRTAWASTRRGEALRILAVSIDLARQGQLALRGAPPPAPGAPGAPPPAAPAAPAPGAPSPAPATPAK